MAIKYTEENGQYSIDCTTALWSTDEIHKCYQDASHTYGIIGFLCDVDFVIETQSHILLVEYKNASIPGAAHPERFNPSSENKLENVAKKFYDSSHWLYLMELRCEIRALPAPTCGQHRYIKKNCSNGKCGANYSYVKKDSPLLQTALNSSQKLLLSLPVCSHDLQHGPLQLLVHIHGLKPA